MSTDNQRASLESLGQITEMHFDSAQKYPIPTDNPGESTEIIAGTCHIGDSTVEAKITKNSLWWTEHVYIVINDAKTHVTEIVTWQVGAWADDLSLSIVPDSGDISMVGRDPHAALARHLDGVNPHGLDTSKKEVVVRFLAELRKKAA